MWNGGALNPGRRTMQAVDYDKSSHCGEVSFWAIDMFWRHCAAALLTGGKSTTKPFERTPNPCVHAGTSQDYRNWLYRAVDRQRSAAGRHLRPAVYQGSGFSNCL